MTTTTVTLLFTDIVDSTRLWEEQPEAMKDALARHDEILGAVVTDHGGRIIVGTGDGIYAAFPSALGGVAAVIDAQRGLLAESWPTTESLRIRMALHTGEAETIDGDPKGPAANRAARLMALASGGQILLSQASADLVQDRLPAGIGLRDLGEHTLRSLSRPERIYQLTGGGLPDDFPPLRSVATHPNNLPAQLTLFIGRARELSEVGALLQNTRLLTLTGPGGTGKTRLALEIAAERLEHYTDGAWLVELAPLSDSGLLLSAIGGALRVTEQPGRSLATALVEYLRHKRLLLVLDNCEHLIEACARQADELLRAAPDLTILATSREMLGVAGETAYRVPSLTLPEAGGAALDALHRSEAVQLFVTRAAAAQSGFALTAENANAIVDICRRLDGIPLAIELAAARTRALGVADIAARLDDRFRLLTGGSRAALPRQQTLRALVDWSWDLLSGPERMLLRRLSVFAAGWTLEDAEAVCADPDKGPGDADALDALDALDVLDLLAALVSKSLATAETDRDGKTRYRLLETIRQYSRDRLFEAGEAAQTRDRHAAHFLALAEVGGPALKGPDLMPWLYRLRPELDNFRLALEWYLEREPETGLRLACALEMYWVFIGRILTEGLNWLSQLLERTGPLPEYLDSAGSERILLYAHALVVQGRITQALGQFVLTRQVSDAAAALARRVGDGEILSMALGLSGFAAAMMGDNDLAQQHAQEVLALTEDGGSLWDRGLALIGLMQVSLRSRHDVAEAQAYFEEIQRTIRRMKPSPFMKAQVEWGAGMLSAIAGEPEAAVGHLIQSNRLFSELELPLFANTTRSEVAHLLRRQGDLTAAHSHYCETLRAWQTSGSLLAVAHQLESFAYLAVAEGQPERAARLLGAAVALRESAGGDMLPAEREEYDRAVETLRAALPASAFATAWDAGRALDMNAAVDYALGTEHRHSREMKSRRPGTELRALNGVRLIRQIRAMRCSGRRHHPSATGRRLIRSTYARTRACSSSG
jgi:predicted ATPase/class 3 adenylate cyclase